MREKAANPQPFITQKFLDFASDLMRICHTLIPFADELCNHNNYPSDEKVRECFLKYSQVQSVTDSYKNRIRPIIQ